MRSIVQPGPPNPERIQWVEARGRAFSFTLQAGLPLLEVLHLPIVGFVALAIVLTTLVARVELPFKIPGALGALLIAGFLYYVMRWAEGSQLLPPALAMPAMKPAWKFTQSSINGAMSHRERLPGTRRSRSSSSSSAARKA